MGTITVARLDNLYWLGRYIERVYQSIRLYMLGYDKMIDADEKYYVTICEKLGITDTYGSKEAFIRSFAFNEEDPASIAANITRAYDNAMVMRDEISSNALSYVHLIMAELRKAAASDAPMMNMQRILDLILAFWGSLDDEVDDEAIRNAVKAGKRIERLDLFVRFRKPREELVREANRLLHRIGTTSLKYNRSALMHVAAMVEDDPVNYEELLPMIWKIV
ncbi:MAG: alpha-E domain-containing protein [Anaerovoracaceae bacterium]